MRQTVCTDTFWEKKNSFLVLISPLYWNTISHTKVAVASPQRPKLRVLDYFPLKFCFLKENKILNESIHSMKSICVAQKFVILKKRVSKLKCFRWKDEVFLLMHFAGILWDLILFHLVLFFPHAFKISVKPHLLCRPGALLGDIVHHRRGSLAGKPGM